MVLNLLSCSRVYISVKQIITLSHNITEPWPNATRIAFRLSIAVGTRIGMDGRVPSMLLLSAPKPGTSVGLVVWQEQPGRQ